MLTAYHPSIEAFLGCVCDKLHLGVSERAVGAHFKPSTWINLTPKGTVTRVFATRRDICNRAHSSLLVEVGDIKPDQLSRRGLSFCGNRSSEWTSQHLVPSFLSQPRFTFRTVKINWVRISRRFATTSSKPKDLSYRINWWIVCLTKSKKWQNH